MLHDVHPGPLALPFADLLCGTARWLEEGELVGKGKEAVVEDVAGDQGAHAVVVVVVVVVLGVRVLSVVGRRFARAVYRRSVSVLVDWFRSNYDPARPTPSL